MANQARRAREWAARQQAIVDAARELAEAEGWDAVTTRRLAARIEYSQPVLYCHFAGKDEIVAAAAVEGFRELAAVLRRAHAATADPHRAVVLLAAAYGAFADRQPALYQAMFSLRSTLAFGAAEAPVPVRDAFGEVCAAVRPLMAPGRDPGLLAETFLAELHGLVVLRHCGRIRADGAARQLEVLVGRFWAPADQT